MTAGAIATPQVHSFKAPSAEELDRDFLWRSRKALPKRKVASWTRVRADINTEWLNCGHTRELKERTVTRDIALNNRAA